MEIGVRDEAYARQLRSNAERYGMFIEGSEGLPRSESDVEKFERVLRTANEVGAKVIRVFFGGRRYEQFDRAEQYEAFADRSLKSLQLAEPVAARHGIRLAIENHKDWRIPDLLSILERMNSEYVGVCVDTGNSFALLEDSMDIVEAYAPWCFATHLKDMAVAEHEDGFLLADVPLGEGLLDLPEMVRILQKARPETHFSLEMATRDVLTVPCLTEKYWATFSDVPGAVIHHRDKSITVQTTNNTGDNIYIHSIKVDGEVYPCYMIPARRLLSGATIDLEMGSDPARGLGSLYVSSSDGFVRKAELISASHLKCTIEAAVAEATTKIYSRTKPVRVIVNGREDNKWGYDEATKTVTIQTVDTAVIEVVTP